ncbi:MAG: alpha/beta fold hydrolase [Methyloligellaceae bacterium]
MKLDYLLHRETTRVNDGKIAYVDHNKNADKTILALHGLGTNADTWSRQLDVLASAGYRVIAPDLRGFGLSTSHDKISFDLMISDIISLMNHLDIKLFDIMGLSMGGAITQLIALQYPERVNRIILVSTFSKFDTASSLYFPARLLLVKYLSMNAIAWGLSHYIFPTAKELEYRKLLRSHILKVKKDAYIQAIHEVQNFDVSEKLKNLSAPTLIVSGSKDRTVSLKTQTILAELIPAARHIILNGGHAPNVSIANEFNPEMIAFLAEG